MIDKPPMLFQHVSIVLSRTAPIGPARWKYALALPLTDPGFDFSILCEFRKRLVDHQIQDFALNRLLEFCKAQGFIKTNSKQRTDSTYVLARIRHLNRVTFLGETIRATLNELAREAPEFLVSFLQPEWEQRYTHRVEDHRWSKSDVQIENNVRQISLDGQQILDRINQHKENQEILALPAVNILTKVWQQEFKVTPTGLILKETKELAPSRERIISPYDSEATFATKGNESWEGYKVQISETCDQDQPHLITSIFTTGATVTDVEVGSIIHEYLVERDLKPEESLVDGGYISANFLSSSKDLGIEVTGPDFETGSWQSQVVGGLTIDKFQINWEEKYAECPAGKRSISWRAGEKDGKPISTARFAKKDCHSCAFQINCTRAKSSGRTLKLYAQKIHEIHQKMRLKFKNPTNKLRYQLRAGIESTISQGVRRYGLRNCRYRGLEKSTLQHTLTGVAVNLQRLVSWWTEGGRPKPRSRTAFSRLCAMSS